MKAREVEQKLYIRAELKASPSPSLSIWKLPGSTDDNPMEALASLQNREASRARDKIVPSYLRPTYGTQRAPWFTEELRVINRQRQQVQGIWRQCIQV